MQTSWNCFNWLAHTDWVKPSFSCVKYWHFRSEACLPFFTCSFILKRAANISIVSSFLNVDCFNDTLGFRGLWQVCTWAPTWWSSRGIQHGLALGSFWTVSERPLQVQKSDPSLVICQLLVQTLCRLSELNPLNEQNEYGPNIDGENIRCRLCWDSVMYSYTFCICASVAGMRFTFHSFKNN